MQLNLKKEIEDRLCLLSKSHSLKVALDFARAQELSGGKNQYPAWGKNAFYAGE